MKFLLDLKLLSPVIACMMFLLPVNTDAQGTPGIEGGWKLEVKDVDGKFTHILLFSGAYFSWTTHETETGAFIMTKGGSWQRNGKKVDFTYEFHTADTTMVGVSEKAKLRIKDGALTVKGKGLPKDAWTDLDGDAASPLAGPWLFSGRKRDGEIRRRTGDSPRKTMKILTANRFQWIAYNTETKQFFGSGGGNYVAKDGKYTENITFFSRDVTRVGAKLGFEFRVDGEDWHHSGKSSKGDPMYEIWSKRK